MADTPTPGQAAHAAYVAAEHGGPVPPERVATRWRCLLPSEQRGWEAAAQAVLDAWQAQPRLEDRPMADEPTPIELPRCTYCEAYASDTVHLPTGLILYVCEEHYDQWLASQEDTL